MAAQPIDGLRIMFTCKALRRVSRLHRCKHGVTKIVVGGHHGCFTFYTVLHRDAKLVGPKQVVLGVYPPGDVLVAQAATE